MADRNLGFFKGLLTVLIFSVLVFVSIYFFFPNIAFKYFGIAFDREKAIENTVASVIYETDYMTQEEKEKIDTFLSSEEGKGFIKDFSSAIDGGKEKINSFYSSPEFASFRTKVQSFLSSESLEKLGEDIVENVK